MRATLESLCNSFVNNRDAVKNVFKWENDLLVAVCGATFMNKGMTVDTAKLQNCKKMLKESTGVFSNFRGNVELPLVSLLAASEQPEQKLEKIKKYYDVLKTQFSGSEYLVLAAAILADMVSEEQAEQLAQRAKTIYNKMKKDHPFLTSAEDSVYAVLMAVSEKDDEALMEEMEVCYKKLKESFSASNEVQALAHVLAIADGAPEEKCNRVTTLYDALREADVKYGKYHELVVLASLAMLPVAKETMVEDIKAVDAFLAEQKGYGFLGMDKKTRLMHAAMIVSGDYAKSEDAEVAAMVGTLAMVASQQAALCAVMISSAAAVNAASSN